MTTILAWFLPIVSLPVISRIWGRIVRVKHPRFLIKRVVRFYKKTYGIDMADYVGEPDDYQSLSAFFIRPLDRETRVLKEDKDHLVSPADGVLSGLETVYSDEVLQVKGRSYSLREFLGDEVDVSKGFHMATIYLSPSNYHRYHYPLSGTVNRYFHTGGRLFPVNTMGLTKVDKLFIRNERVIVDMERNGLSCYVAAVGATLVGSIKMEFAELTGPLKDWKPIDATVKQLDEMGRFEIGSTIVMAIPADMADPVEGIKGKPVKVGDQLFKWK